MSLSAELSYAIEVVDIEPLSEDEWLKYRRLGIGGSDVAVLMGVSPFATARDLYYDKKNIKPMIDNEDNWVAKEVGHRLEELVAKIFSFKTGYKVFAVRKLFRHPVYPYMQANVDYFVELPDGSIAILECKTSNYNCQDKWADGVVPLNYEWQCRHYMCVMNINRTYIACLFGNNDHEFVYRKIERDLEAEKDMIEMEECFWSEYVLKGVEPPYTESGNLVLESIRRHYGELDTAEKPITISASMVASLERYLKLSNEKSELSKKVKELENQMKKAYAPVVDLMKSGCVGICRTGDTVYEISNKPVYRTNISKESLERLNERHPNIYNDYTETKEIRRFSVKKRETI